MIELAELQNICIYNNKRKDQKINNNISWKHKLNERINLYRGEINKIEQIKQVTKSKKIKRNSKHMIRKYSIYDEEKRKEIIEKHKQRVNSLNNIIKRYVTRENQFSHNKMFY